MRIWCIIVTRPPRSWASSSKLNYGSRAENSPLGTISVFPNLFVQDSVSCLESRRARKCVKIKRICDSLLRNMIRCGNNYITRGTRKNITLYKTVGWSKAYTGMKCDNRPQSVYSRRTQILALANSLSIFLFKILVVGKSFVGSHLGVGFGLSLPPYSLW